MYPTGIIINTETGRFHPVVFRPAPLPGGSELPRYKSLGHHTTGFDTEDEAIAWAKEGPDRSFIDHRWEWNGKDVPALVIFLPD
jgi:hypothetical protein